MATIITNQATLNYRYGTSTATATSNITTAVLNGPLSISKTSLSQSYRVGQNVTYLITVTNNGTAGAEDITIIDDLGTFLSDGNNVTPLTYLGPSQLFINGAFESEITPTLGANNIAFMIPSIPAGGNAQIIYLVRVNSYASSEAGSEITNTATADFDCGCPCNEPVSDSYTITAEEFADVRIVKTICPNPVVCGSTVTFTFNLYNYGNIPATDVVLTDTFDPALSDIEVFVDDVLIPSEDYNYINGTLRLPALGSDFEITIPAATFERDDVGNITVTPGNVRIVVRGTI